MRRVRKSITESIMDALREGRDISVYRLQMEQRKEDMLLACEALTEAKVSDMEILRLIGKYWDLRPSDAEYILGLSREN